MKKLNKFSIIFILFLSFSIVQIPLAQTPHFYNHASTSGTANAFPFTIAGGKAVNTLILPGEINKPYVVPSGYQITAVYFFMASAGTRTFTNLHILLAQSTITTFTSGQFYEGPYDTVYQRASVSVSCSASNSWMGFQLDKPFVYDPTKSLIIFVGQCGTTGSGLNVRNQTYTNNRRVWSVGGCPFVPYSSADAAVVGFGIDVVPINYTPNLIYYKFENNPTPTTSINCAYPGVGTSPFVLTGLTLTSGGQFDSCVYGTGVAGAGINSGWSWNLGGSSWTVGLWVQIPTNPSGSAYYIFGDAGANSLRCFHNGVAGPDSLILRATNMNDVRIPKTGPDPTHVAFVYDSVTATIYGYKNGVLVNTVSQTPLNFPVGTGFKVGGYSSSANIVGKFDEFRVYKGALTAAQIAASWNLDVQCGTVTGITKYPELPLNYSLNQNYPNPFNPTTKISFSLPESGFVTLKVFDVIGREVATLINENKLAGNYIVEFDASSLSSGVYFYTLKVNGFSDTKRMILVK